MSHWEKVNSLWSVGETSTLFKCFCNQGLSAVKNAAGSKTVVNHPILDKIGLHSNSLSTMLHVTDLLSS